LYGFSKSIPRSFGGAKSLDLSGEEIAKSVSLPTCLTAGLKLANYGTAGFFYV